MRFILIGFGKFGKIAFKRLKESHNHSEFVLVDPKISGAELVTDHDTIWIQENGPEYLAKHGELLDTDIIVPVAPFNVAAVFVSASKKDIEFVEIPSECENYFPGAFRLDKSNLCVSHATFLCPDDCEEGLACTVTGEVRTPMFELINRFTQPDFHILVLKSNQLAPGVGGYTLGALRSMRDNVISGHKFLLATSCRCHGIITAIQA